MIVVQARRAFIVAATCLALSGCGGNASPGAPVPEPTPSAAPTFAPSRLYVEFGAPGSPFAAGVAVYALPLSPASAPLLTTSGQFGSLAFDTSGNMFVSRQNEIDEYAAPLTSSSSPQPVVTAGAASIPTSVHDIQFDLQGDLWAQTDFDLREFPAPVTRGALAATIVSGGGNAALSFDPVKGTLYSGPLSPRFGDTPLLQIYSGFPYTVPPKKLSVPFGVPIGFDGNGNAIVYTNGFTVNGIVQPSGLSIVALPFSGSSLPAVDVPFSLYAGQSSAHTVAMDGNGNIYAIDASNANAVTEFSLPFTAASMPALRLPAIPGIGSANVPLAVYAGP